MGADQYTDQRPGGIDNWAEPIPGNSIVGTVWNLVTVDANNPVKDGWTILTGLSWEGYANPNHHVLLKDGHGNVVFESYGHVDLDPVAHIFGNPTPVWKLTVAGLDSGRVVVWVE